MMSDKNKQGMLYLVATPIGNLEDMTFRAVRVLKEVDLIAAEDTRNTIKLLNHFEIKTPMTSYHEHNKIEKAYELVRLMESGKNIALVTDAGMPAISDPGEDLVRIAYENAIEVHVVPGACACVSALSLSSLSSRRFVFEGFPDRRKVERRRMFDRLKNETRTIIIYEAPHHLKETLEDLFEALGERRISIVKEITKKHENVLVTGLEKALEYYDADEPRGEYVLVIEGKSEEELAAESEARWKEISVGEHVNMYIERGLDKKEAMKRAAKDRGVSKRDIYNALLSPGGSV